MVKLRSGIRVRRGGIDWRKKRRKNANLKQNLAAKMYVEDSEISFKFNKENLEPKSHKICNNKIELENTSKMVGIKKAATAEPKVEEEYYYDDEVTVIT